MSVWRRHPTLIAFVVAALAACGALGWVTAHALRLEGEQRWSRAQALVQERSRLALWRMDSMVGAILSREAARPYFVYQAFYPAERAYTKMLEPVHGGEVLVPSPLLAAPDRFVRLHFQVGSDGVFTSPQAPTGNLRDLAEPTYVPRGAVETARQRLEFLSGALGESRKLVRREDVVSPGRVELSDTVVKYIENALRSGSTDVPTVEGALQSPQAQTQMVMQQSADEYRARQALSSQNVAPQSEIGQQLVYSKVDAAKVSPTGTPMPADGGESRKDKVPASAPAGEPGGDRGGNGRTPTIPREEADRSASGGEAANRPELARKSEAGEKSEPGLAEPESISATAIASGPGVASGVDREQAAADWAAGTPWKAPEADRVLEFGALAKDGVESQVQVGAFEACWVGGVAPPGQVVPAGGMARPTGAAPVGGGELVFVRDVAAGEAVIRQGFWVDWPGLRGELLKGVHDLLPRAQIHPLHVADDTASPAELGRRLASFPAELDPGDIAATVAFGWSALRISLAASWGGMLLALGAIATALRAATDLAERRGRFVSAVTHELRTPLTTFCLYSQMLADGMVPEGEARAEYLRTLRRESSRLAGIVETVLDYARLGRRNQEARRRVDPGALGVGELLDRIVPSLAQRAAQGGMSLISAGTIPAGWTVRADASAVERILYNLVDNSCKYAGGAQDKRIDLSARLDGSRLVVRVGDHGPGIAPEDRQRIFKAFERGTPQGDGSIPGLGLGLALAQGLARDMGGRLRLVAPNPATFELELPAVKA